MISFFSFFISRHFHFRSRRKTVDAMRLPLQFYFMYLFYFVLALLQKIYIQRVSIYLRHLVVRHYVIEECHHLANGCTAIRGCIGLVLFLYNIISYVWAQ